MHSTMTRSAEMREHRDRVQLSSVQRHFFDIFFGKNAPKRKIGKTILRESLINMVGKQAVEGSFLQYGSRMEASMDVESDVRMSRGKKRIAVVVALVGIVAACVATAGFLAPVQHSDELEVCV